MWNRPPAILALLLAVWPALVPARTVAQTVAPRTARQLPATSKTQGPTTHQLGLAPAPFRLFIQVTNTDGSAVSGLAPTNDPLYAGWTDLYSFGGGASKTLSTRNTSTKATLVPLTLYRTADATTTTLFSRLTQGLASNFTFVVVRNAPDRIESWKIKCTNAYVTEQQFVRDVNESSGSAEYDTITAAAMEWSYLNTNATGQVLNEIYAGYDTTTNTPTYGTRTPTYPGGQDTNNNGIPDGWETFYGFDISNPKNGTANAMGDLDGDGQNNLAEYLAGTVPNDPASVLRMSAVGFTTISGGPAVKLTWNSVANKTYQVQSASGPGGPWTAVGSTVPSLGNGTTNTTVDATGKPTFFYRVVVVPAAVPAATP